MNVRVRDGKKFQHDGIRIELIGSIGQCPDRLHNEDRLEPPADDVAELFYDRGNHYEFVSLAQELAAGGEMRQAQSYDFVFKNVEKQYESYSGINVKLRYARSRDCIPCRDSHYQVLPSCHPSEKNGRGDQREGSLGTLVPYATRFQYQH